MQEWLRAQVSDLSYALTHYTFDWRINRLYQGADTKLVSAPSAAAPPAIWMESEPPVICMGSVNSAVYLMTKDCTAVYSTTNNGVG
eukprot:COSAG02_NODE_440_length_22296_cov_173.657386_6_plen_86_part_00